MYLVVDDYYVCRILNPDAAADEPWLVDLNGKTVEVPPDQGEWFGEYEDDILNFRAALQYVNAQLRIEPTEPFSIDEDLRRCIADVVYARRTGKDPLGLLLERAFAIGGGPLYHIPDDLTNAEAAELAAEMRREWLRDRWDVMSALGYIIPAHEEFRQALADVLKEKGYVLLNEPEEWDSVSFVAPSSQRRWEIVTPWTMIVENGVAWAP